MGSKLMLRLHNYLLSPGDCLLSLVVGVDLPVYLCVVCVCLCAFCCIFDQLCSFSLLFCVSRGVCVCR